MKQLWSKYLAALLALALVAVPVLAAERGKNKAKPAATEKSPTAACLDCHGPFDKLASAPPNFVSQSGETVNPHRYVPHDLKEIPECVGCHKPHSADPTKSELDALPKPNITTCFSCHHAENFKSCKSCHKPH